MHKYKPVFVFPGRSSGRTTLRRYPRAGRKDRSRLHKYLARVCRPANQAIGNSGNFCIVALRGKLDRLLEARAAGEQRADAGEEAAADTGAGYALVLRFRSNQQHRDARAAVDDLRQGTTLR